MEIHGCFMLHSSRINEFHVIFPQLISWFISFSFYCVLNNIQPVSYVGPSCLFCGKLGYSIFSPVFILSMPSYHIMIKKIFINTCKNNCLFSPLLTGSFIIKLIFLEGRTLEGRWNCSFKWRLSDMHIEIAQ